jgi:hypothetical protein
MNRLFLLVGALLSLAFAAPASAGPILYTVTNANGVFASFTLDDHPTPEPLLQESYAFFFTDVLGTYADGSAKAGLSFYDFATGGGISILTANFTLADLTGIVLFDGAIDMPHLLTFGPTQFTELNDGSIYTISAVTLNAVPEPAAWAMLVLGFGVVGAGIRRRAQTTRVAFG